MYLPASGRGRDHLVTIHIPVNPIPCPRPRVSRWGTFYPQSYYEYKDEARPFVPPLSEVWECPLAVHFEFALSRPKSTKYAYPVRGDLDNFLKTACDLITSSEGYWKDDRQVVAETSIKRWADQGEQPHTTIEIYRYEP